MHEVLVNRLGGLSLPRKSVVRLTDRPDMTLDVYRGRKTTIQPTNLSIKVYPYILSWVERERERIKSENKPLITSLIHYYIDHQEDTMIYNGITIKRVLPVCVYMLRKDSKPRRLRQLRLAIKETSLTNCPIAPLRSPKKSFMGQC